MIERAPIVYQPAWKRRRSRWLVGGTLVLLTTGGGVLAWPGYATHQAASYLAAAANTSDSQIKELDLKSALWYQPSYAEADYQLAKLYLSQGRHVDAIKLFDKMDAGRDANRLRVMIRLEDGEVATARTAAAGLLKSATSDDDRSLAALAFLATGDKTSAGQAKALLESTEAAQRVTRAENSDIALGIELAATGLPNSAERVLSVLPASFMRDAVLAGVYRDHGSRADLIKARDLFASALILKPADVDVRAAYAEVLTALGDISSASIQRERIARLQAGKP